MRDTIICAWCGKASLKERGAITRSRSQGNSLYCNRTCAGLGRRKHKTRDQCIAEKAEYDRAYRAKNLSELKAKKAARFRATYDPVAAAVARKANMPRHVAYCRRPEYRAKKSGYDLKRRASKFGDFAESYAILSDIEREIADRATRYEIYSANGTLNKKLQRRRAYEQSIRR